MTCICLDREAALLLQRRLAVVGVRAHARDQRAGDAALGREAAVVLGAAGREVLDAADQHLRPKFQSTHVHTTPHHNTTTAARSSKDPKDHTLAVFRACVVW